MRRIHDQAGPDLDLNADEIEQIAMIQPVRWPREPLRDSSSRKAGVLRPEQQCHPTLSGISSGLALTDLDYTIEFGLHLGRLRRLLLVPRVCRIFPAKGVVDCTGRFR